LLTARSDLAVRENMVFIPFAYVEAAANILTNPQLDPVGKIPEYKYCAVRIEPADGKEPRLPESRLEVTGLGV
jgi:formate dehydrogenase major subunit